MIDKYINSFKKNGYLIKKTNNNKSLNYLQNEIYEFLLSSKPKLKKITKKNDFIRKIICILFKSILSHNIYKFKKL